MRLIKRGSYSSHVFFLPFPYKKSANELHSSTENCDTSASSSAAFVEVRNVLGSAEVKFSTSETKPTSSFFCILEI